MIVLLWLLLQVQVEEELRELWDLTAVAVIITYPLQLTNTRLFRIWLQLYLELLAETLKRFPNLDKTKLAII
jgi:hypothetical protein